jgi:hypothetical protein
MAREQRDHVRPGVEIRDDRQRRLRDLSERGRGVRGREILDLDPSGQSPVVIHREEIAQPPALERAQATESLCHRQIRSQRRDPRVHQTTGHVGRILEEVTQLPGDRGVERGEDAFSGFRIEVGERRDTGAGVGLGKETGRSGGGHAVHYRDGDIGGQHLPRADRCVFRMRREDGRGNLGRHGLQLTGRLLGVIEEESKVQRLDGRPITGDHWPTRPTGVVEGSRPTVAVRSPEMTAQ